MPRPERLPLITVNLVKGFTDSHTSSLQLDMYKGKAVDQYCNIIAIVVFCTVFLTGCVLIDNLQPVVVDVLFIYEHNVFGRSIITSQYLDIIFLYFSCLFHDMLIGIGNGIFEKIIPLCIGKLIMIQF